MNGLGARDIDAMTLPEFAAVIQAWNRAHDPKGGVPVSPITDDEMEAADQAALARGARIAGR